MGNKKGDACRDCHFFIRSTDDVGECRRHPPVIVGPIEFNDFDEVWRRTLFPNVEPDQWCGDYIPAAAKT